MSDKQFDLARARAETPGVRHVVHLNNAGAALMPQVVADATMDYMRLESQIGAYEAAERSQEKIEYAHEAIARLINCHPSELAILDSASRAWAMALYALPLRAGDRIIISALEYGSNYISLLHLSRRLEVSVEVLPADTDGLVDVTELESRLDERVGLIALPHVPMHDGLVNPVSEIGKVARRHGIPYMVDACQSVGQLPVDVAAIGCDLLVGSGRKFLRGPRGAGFLYVRQEIAHKLSPAVPGLDGVEWVSGTYRMAPGARRFETWEMNCASRIGLGVAIGYALDWGVENTWLRIKQLAKGLRDDLAGIPRVRLEDRGRERCGIIALTFDGHDCHWVRAKLQCGGINTWVCLDNAACLDMQTRGLRSLLRISPHYYNSPDELARLCSVLEQTLAAGRRHAATISHDQTAIRRGVRRRVAGSKVLEDFMHLVDDSLVAILPHALRVAAELGIADILAEGKASVQDLARATGANEESLYRLLRALVSINVFARAEDGHFALTDLGNRLRGDEEHSIYASVLNRDTAIAWLAATEAFRSGKASFTTANGRDFFAQKDADVHANLMFQRRMRERSQRAYGDMAELISLMAPRVVMDVGGGDGFVLGRMLDESLLARGVLFDRPAVIELAARIGELNRHGDRCRLVAGDFFREIPTGADTHVMCSVLHDWEDEQVRTILRHSRRALAPGGRLFIVEMVIPEDESVHPSLWSDLGMFVLTGGRERNKAEFTALLSEAGYCLNRLIPVAGTHFSLIEARPASE